MLFDFANHHFYAKLLKLKTKNTKKTRRDQTSLIDSNNVFLTLN